MAFNQLLGLRVTEFAHDRAEVRFAWKADLVGNPVQQILHGGVIASVLDVVGGIMAVSSALVRLDTLDHAQLPQNLANEYHRYAHRLSATRPRRRVYRHRASDPLRQQSLCMQNGTA